MTEIVKTFAVASTGNLNGLATWDTAGQCFKIDSTIGPASGLAGLFPTGNAWIRSISLTVFGGNAGDWAIVGHSGPNGDWVTPPVVAGAAGHAEKMVTFDGDAAFFFAAGEYLDVHCHPEMHVIVWVSYVNAP